MVREMTGGNRKALQRFGLLRKRNLPSGLWGRETGEILPESSPDYSIFDRAFFRASIKAVEVMVAPDTISTSADLRSFSWATSFSRAKDAKETDSLGFRFVKDNVASEIAAVDMVVAEMALPLMLGQVNPDDRAQGVQALKEALQDAGINEIIAEVQKQYKAWKASK